jgi:hypothetical protein
MGLAVIAVYATAILVLFVGVIRGFILLATHLPGALGRIRGIRNSPREFAERCGWSYQEEDFSLSGRWAGYPFDPVALGDEGRSRYPVFRDVLGGKVQNCDVRIFHYQPHEGAASCNIFVVRLSQSLPDIGIAVVDGKELRYGDEDFSRLLITPEFRKRLKRLKSRYWRISGEDLISWQYEADYRPIALMVHAGRLVEVAQTIAPQVWQEYGGRSTQS